jgi:prepilin-type N-terminal cleavage/methylation domain-containing protein
MTNYTLSQRRLGEAGFSLAEMLVVLALLALIGTLLSTAIWSGRRTLEAAERAQTQSSVDAACQLFKDLVSGAHNIDPIPNDDRRSPFLGRTEGVVFVSRLEKRGNFAGLYHINLRLMPNQSTSPNGRTLVVELQLYRPRQGAPRATAERLEQHKLLPGVDRMTLRYFGQRATEDVAQWHDDWTDVARLPLLVALNIRFVSSRQGHDFDLTVSLPTATDHQ